MELEHVFAEFRDTASGDNNAERSIYGEETRMIVARYYQPDGWRAGTLQFAQSGCVRARRVSG